MNILPFILFSFPILSAPFFVKLYQYPQSEAKKEQIKTASANHSSANPVLSRIGRIDLENKKDELLSQIVVRDCVVKIKSSNSSTFTNLVAYKNPDDLLEIRDHFYSKLFNPKCFIASQIKKGFLGFTKEGDKWNMNIFVSRKSTDNVQDSQKVAVKRHVIVSANTNTQKDK